MDKRFLNPDGEEIRRLRLTKGWSREKLASKTSNVSTDTIKRAENSRPVRPDKLIQIARALGVKLEEITHIGTGPGVMPTAERNSAAEYFISGSSGMPEGTRSSLVETDIMNELGKVFLAQHVDKHCEYIRCGNAVTAYSLLAARDPAADALDEVHYKATFKTLGDPIHCRCLSITNPHSQGLSIAPQISIFSVTDGREVSTFIIPVRARHASTRREWLVYFNPILAPHSGPYQLDVRYQSPQFVAPLRVSGRDELTFYLRRNPTDQVVVDFVLKVPVDYRSIEMRPMNSITPGRAMTKAEIGLYGPTPPRFSALGWTGVEPTGGNDYGVEIRWKD